MRLGKQRKTLGMLALCCTALLLSGCGTVLMDPKGAIGEEQKKLILTALGLMLIVVIPVIIMVFAFVWRYRGSNTKATYRPTWAHSNKIEAVVWGVPIIIILILATITWKTTHELDPYRPLDTGKKPLTIEVVSLDWKWLFIYPEQGIATVNQLAFPTDVPIAFKITSDTVMNAFFIPRLGGQIYAMAGMQTQLHLIANQPGTYDGISSSYSGAGFSGMKFTAIATPTQEAFDQWVKKVKQSPDTLKTTQAFNQLAAPSENNPVAYYSSVKPQLFQEIIAKYMGDMKQMKMDHKGSHKTMEMATLSHAGVKE
ncbi:cytochrome o ubiquinol oxidase subunit II [Dongshaea marina]|uniref:cytochrome o ubiquinol oxidase subunit II n=1 Tax=Dongshaea marina TaxID=2047966 RepID=UPI000D3E496A|nr:cytochrome o ubiquinol oxidase subunit II [Dongshaea marina]